MKKIFLVFLIFLYMQDCFSQSINVSPHTKRVHSQIPSIKNNLRKICDIHLAGDKIGNVFIGGNRVKLSNSGFAKLRSYDIDVYSEKFELLKSHVLVYPDFNFIKNMDIATIESQAEMGDAMIIGGAMRNGDPQDRGTVLTRIDNMANTMHYKYVTFVFNGQPIRTGGVSVKPIYYGGYDHDDQFKSNYFIGIAKDFDNTKGSGAVLFIFDQNLNIIKHKYLNIDNGNDLELSFNDIVQIGFSTEVPPNDNSILDYLSNNNVVFAIQGSSSNRTHSVTDAYNLNSFKEVLTIVDPNLNVLSSYKNTYDGICKGADLYFDERTRILYTLGNYRDQNDANSSFYLSKYKLDDQNKLNYVASSNFESTIINPLLYSKRRMDLFGSPYKQQTNATSLIKVDDKLVVAGNIEGSITKFVPQSTGKPNVNYNLLSHFSFIQKYDLDLNLSDIQVNAFDKLKSNYVYLQDFNYYNSPSSRTLSSEFTPKSIVNTLTGLKSVFNSDFPWSDIKYNGYRTIDPRIAGCDINGIAINSGGKEFILQEIDNLIQSNDLEFQEEAFTNVIEDENTSIYKCSQPFGVGIDNGCTTPKNLGFTANATFNNQTVSGSICENIGKISFNNTAGNTTGYLEMIFKNLQTGYIVSINPTFANDYYLQNLGNHTYRIYRYDNTIPQTTLTNLVFVRRMRPNSTAANALVASIDINFVFHNTRSNNINIPIHRNVLYNGATFSCNTTPQAVCTNVINPISNVIVTTVPGCNTVNIQFDFQNHTGNTQMKVGDFIFKLSHLFGTVNLSAPGITINRTFPNNSNLTANLLTLMNGNNSKIRVVVSNVPVNLQYNNAMVLDYTYQRTGTAYTNTPYCQRMQFSKSLISLPSSCCPPAKTTGDPCNSGTHDGEEDLFTCSNDAPPPPPIDIIVPDFDPSTTVPVSNNYVDAADGTHSQNADNDGAGSYSDTESKSTKPTQSNIEPTVNIASSVVPNPNDGKFRLVLDEFGLSSDQMMSIEVRNISGQIVHDLKISYDRLHTGIELNTLSNGIYYLKISKNDVFLTNAKLQIQR